MKQVSLDVVTSPGCTHCHAFLEYWKTIAKDWPNVTLRDLSVTTPEGQELVSKHMIFSAPGIILNGEIFASGGVDQKQFVEKLKVLSAD
ncbi:MAG: thioredoxin family protein [Patescibacteria group bacterium]